MQSDELLREYLHKCHVMQLATVQDTQPHISSVYYVNDDKFNLYWASWPERRHSQRLLKNDRVAATIVVQSDKDKPVCGIQITGRAEICEDPATIEPVAALYAQKFGRDSEWIKSFSRLKTKHRLYKLTPELVELFDETKFKDNPVTINLG